MTQGDAARKRVGWLRRLFRRWRPQATAIGNGQAALVERLDALDYRLGALDERLSAGAPDLAALQQAVSSLGTQIGRAGREQFKANALVEAQREQLDEALAALCAAQARSADELAAAQSRWRDAAVAERLDLAQRLLPALDGLDEALRTGNALLDQAPTPRPQRPDQPLLARLFGRQPEMEIASDSAPEDRALREAMRSWLVGLEFVRQRLLDVLATDDVAPIEAQGRLFDPHLHVALETVPASAGQPAGTVASELRRGYRVGDRVLRYAEVAVAANGASTEGKEGGG